MTTGTQVSRPLHACLLAMALAIPLAPAQAQNLHGLGKGTPAEAFNEEDNRLFGAASKKALDAAAVGETVTWANPATGSRGDLTVVKAFAWKQNACREVRVRNEAQGRKATTSPTLCKVADKWRLVSPSELNQR